MKKLSLIIAVISVFTGMNTAFADEPYASQTKIEKRDTTKIEEKDCIFRMLHEIIHLMDENLQTNQEKQLFTECFYIQEAAPKKCEEIKNEIKKMLDGKNINVENLKDLITNEVLKNKNIVKFLKETYETLNKNAKKNLKNLENLKNKNFEKSPEGAEFVKLIKTSYKNHKIQAAESYNKVGYTAPGNEGKTEEEKKQEVARQVKKLKKESEDFSGNAFKEYIEDCKFSLDRSKNFSSGIINILGKIEKKEFDYGKIKKVMDNKGLKMILESLEYFFNKQGKKKKS